VQPPFKTSFTRFHIKASFRRCCPRFQTVATYFYVIALSRTASGRCCPRVWMDADCMHAISLLRISASGRYCPVVWTGVSSLPTPCLQRKAGTFSNSEERPDGCNLQLFRSFSTLMGVQTETKDSAFLVGICTESSLNTEIAFCKYFEDSKIYGIPDYDSNITCL
jgi:hypothetical protein